MHVAKNKFHKKITNIAYTPRGVCHDINCTPSLWMTRKVLLSDEQILENYACCLVHGTNASCCQCWQLHAHSPNQFFMKLPNFYKRNVSLQSLDYVRILDFL